MTETVETRLENVRIAWRHNLAAYGAEVADYRTGASYQIVRLRGEGMRSRMAQARANDEGWTDIFGMADVWDCDDSVAAFMDMVTRFTEA